MKLFRILGILSLGLMAFSHQTQTQTSASADDFCGLKNTSFQASEQISYVVYYNVAGIFVNAGTATFSATLEKMNNRPVYHVVGDGKTNPNYDFLFKFREKNESG